jgi:hypothetical protein
MQTCLQSHSTCCKRVCNSNTQQKFKHTLSTKLYDLKYLQLVRNQRYNSHLGKDVGKVTDIYHYILGYKHTRLSK